MVIDAKFYDILRLFYEIVLPYSPYLLVKRKVGYPVALTALVAAMILK